MSVIFDQLRISDDGKRLYINVHVNNAVSSDGTPLFDNIYLNSITIMTADKVLETDPYAPTEDFIFKKTFSEDIKEIGLVLTAEDFIKTWEDDAQAMKFLKSDMSRTLFFVYVETRGVFDECTPCMLDEPITLGVTFDENLLYQRVMDYTKSLADDCTIPIGFTDFILLWNAFKAAVETEHYIPAIKYFNMLFGFPDERASRDGSHSPFGGSTYTVHSERGCGCHG